MCMRAEMELCNIRIGAAFASLLFYLFQIIKSQLNQMENTKTESAHLLHSSDREYYLPRARILDMYHPQISPVPPYPLPVQHVVTVIDENESKGKMSIIESSLWVFFPLFYFYHLNDMPTITKLSQLI